MFQFNSLVIAGFLFLLIVIANEVGLRIGEYFEGKSDEDIKSQTTAIQGGIIGLLALVLGFSFNMSLQRYDSRAGAEVAEANAIGTAVLRTDLLPAPYSTRAQEQLDEYIALRLEINDTDLTQLDVRKQLNNRTSDLQNRIWNTGMDAAEREPNPVKTGYYVQAINDMIDAQGARNDVLSRHIPPAIFYLLFVIFVATAGLIGYSSGLGRKTSRAPALILGLLISMMVFIILDLDRPRRGMIEVKQDSMEALVK
ncbi:bestrophin-like domain [Neolewinella antarctica]|uniref:DUF4239 domain-containing protein n=1 Tax=Neolewinella antarctica TaxID=442734 RepID=A0ABX0XEH9_9BACT|nr:hypothetical protein [Neolewinella antarctica]NJC27646.1 hypothetical protein [Neolewinella antarctica]